MGKEVELRRKIEKALFLFTSILLGASTIVWTQVFLESFINIELLPGVNVQTALGLLFLYLFARFWTGHFAGGR